MDKQELFYYATNPELPNYLIPFLQSEDYELKAYQIGEAINASIFLLFSPVWIHNCFISCDQSWKNYLQIENPQVKLISVGTVEVVHPNYIDILNLPNNFNYFFTNAKPAADSWTPIYTGGLKMEAKLHRFFEGHGNDSVSQVFTPINRQLNIIKDELKQGTAYAELWSDLIIPAKLPENWRIFRNRFINYYPYFFCLPFFTLFEKIYILVNELDAFFEQNCNNAKLFEALQCATKVNQIKELLSQTEKYV